MNLTRTKLDLLTNTGVQFLARLFSAFLSFLLSLIIIRHLGVSFYGNFVKITALLFFNNTFVDLGINALVVRRLAKLSPRNQTKLLNQLFYLRLFLTFLITAATLSWLFLFNPPHYPLQLKLAYLIGSLSVFSFAFHLSAIAHFQFNLTYYKSALANSLGSLSFFLLALLIVLFSPNLKLLLLSFSLGYFLTALTSFLFTQTIFQFKPKLSHLSSASKLLLASLWISLTFIFSSLANKSDILIASLYRSAAEIGQYGFAYKIFDFVIVIPSLFMNAVYPLLLKRNHSRRKLTLKAGLILLILSLVLLAVGYFAAPLILYLKPGLELSVRLLRILLLSLPLFYLTPPLMWHLVAFNQEKQLAFVYAGATILNLSLNFLFVPHYGVLASAYITLVTELLIFVGLIYLFLRHSQDDTITTT